MGYRLNIALNRIQTRVDRLSERLESETWERMVRTWTPRTWPFAVIAGLWFLAAWLWPGMRFSATLAGGAVVVAGALPWLAAGTLLTAQAVFNWRARQARRAAHQPPRKPDGSVDWAAIDSYVLLSEAAWYDVPKTLEAMMTGPMNRFIEMAEDRAVPIRGRAREMEFARIVPEAFKRRRARKPEAARRVDETVLAELERRLADQGSDGRYLIDVYLGKRTHNG